LGDAFVVAFGGEGFGGQLAEPGLTAESPAAIETESGAAPVVFTQSYARMYAVTAASSVFESEPGAVSGICVETIP
jgi:hypothetical protein